MAKLVTRQLIAVLMLQVGFGLGLALPLTAQAAAGGEGRILGQILSAESGSPLPGAQLQLEGAGRGGVAGIDGRYQLLGIPVGEVTLRVTLLGYAPKTVTGIAVRDGETVRLDVSLDRQMLEIAGLTVTAQQERGSSVSLLNEQRVSASVVNAISAEQISRSPDGDAAAAMRRVSGVTVQDGKYIFVRGLGERYTTSSLNGARIPSPDPERKTVPLDLFPAGLLESISTSKTFTPDQSGDFSGGSVNIRTPEFPVRPTYSLSFSSGYHPEVMGRSILAAPSESGDWFAWGASPRQVPVVANNFSGTSTRGDEVNSVVNSFRNVWTVQEATGRMPISMSGSVAGSRELGYGDRTLGYIGSLTYSNAQEVKLEQRRAQVGTGSTEINRFDGEEGNASVLWGGLANVSLLIGTHTQLHLNNTFSRSSDSQARRETGTDENTRALVRVDRMTYVERSVRSHQLQGQHQLSGVSRVDWSINHAAVSRAEPDRSEFVTWLDPAIPIWFKDFEGAVRTFGQLDEHSYEGSVALARTIGGSLGDPNRIRAGIQYRRNVRDAVSQGFRLQPFLWTPDDPRWQVAPELFFDGRYSGPGDEYFILSRELAGGSYDAHDHLGAGFLMGEVSVTESLRLVGGARVEYYRLNVNSQNQLGQRSNVIKSYTDILPALSATLQLSESQQLRASVSQTLARPEYREVAPITYREVLGGDQVIGNTSLERTLIQNADLRWEWYPRPGEVISIGGFAKRFDAPIEQRYLARSGTNTRTFENAETGTSYGAELEIHGRLDSLHPALEPLSVFSNLTVMMSSVDTGNEGDPKRSMVGQAPYVVNTGMTYFDELRGLSATLLYNVVGERIVNARASGTLVDNVIESSRHVVDLSFRFPVLGNASGKVDLKNLLDAPFEVTQGEIVRDRYSVGRSVSVGLSLRW